MRRQVETRDIEAWMIRLYLAEKSPGSAGDIEQPRRPPTADRMRGECALQGDERLASHRRCAAAEKHLDLMVVALGGSTAQISIGLKMEFLQVVARISTRRHPCQHALLAPAMAPLFDRAQIGKEIESAADLLERLAEPIGRRRIVTGLDVAPILLH